LPREEVIDANNQWRKEMKAWGLTLGMSMMESYSEVRATSLFFLVVEQDTVTSCCRCSELNFRERLSQPPIALPLLDNLLDLEVLTSVGPSM
jgi:hypothetical protein